MSVNSESSNVEVPSHRACANCRAQKVRCITDEESPNVCQRCARSGRQCVFTPLQKRKQRKRTDTRVAELEKEMRVMHSMLKHKRTGPSAGEDDLGASAAVSRPSTLSYNESLMPGPGTASRLAASGASDHVGPYQSTDERRNRNGQIGPRRLLEQSFVSDGKDVVDRDIISMATARQLFETYRSEHFPHYPMVPVPTSMSADEMRKSKPILFLAIIAAAASKEDPDLSATLDKEVLHAYATRSLVNSQKSLEMVQALLISAVWYHPPDRFGHLKYYEYIHMAATIAMDIGIGTRPVPHRSRFGQNTQTTRGHPSRIHPLEDATNPDLSMAPRSRESSPKAGSIESRRTFISVYSVCTSVSMSLRRPNMIRISSYVRECVEFLEHSSDALLSDRVLVAWVRLLMIAEEITNAFSYDDPGGIASIIDLRTQLMLKDFTKRLEAWLKDTPKESTNSSLMIIYWTTRLYLNELALHIDHSPEDFKAPYQMGMIHQWDGDDIPTEVLAQTVAECVTCSHELINTFLAVEGDLRSLPVLSYVRVSYAAFILAKLGLSANHPESQIARVLDSNSLQAQSILDKAILRIQTVLGPSRCRVPSIFLALLFKLRQWCLHPELIEPPQTSFIDIGMQEAVDKANEPEPAESSVAQRSSAEESSPQTLPDVQAGVEVMPSDRSHSDVNVVGAQQQRTDLQVSNSTSSMYPSNVTTIPTVTGDDPTLSSFLNPCQQMDLDENFFQLFSDASGLESIPMGFDTFASLYNTTGNLDMPDDMAMEQSERL